MQRLALAALLAVTSLASADDLDKARSLLGGKQHKEGVALIRKVIAAAKTGDPDADKLQLIGRGHFYLEEDDKAKIAFLSAIKLAPKEPECHFWLGLVQMYSDLDAARLSMATAVQLGPKVARYQFELGRILQFLKRPKEALVAYRKACELDKNHGTANTKAGNVLAGLDRPEEARKHYEAAIAIDGKQLEARYNLGQLHYNAKRFAEALAQWKAVHEVDANDFGVNKKIVQALYAVDKFKDAAPYREKLFALRKKMKKQPRDFCFDQFDAGKFRVFAYERFEKSGDLYYHFVFKVMDAHGKTVRTVNLESSAVTREMGVAYILGGNESDGSHHQFGPMWKKMPEYAALRKMVVDAADGKPGK